MSAETREEYIGDEIQKLIAPPVSNEGKSQKRGWRRRNNEYCEACRDGGELVCCEKCPVSYHPTCTNPPCDANDLPDKWICRGCTLKMNPTYEEEEEESQQKGLFDLLLAHKKPMNPTNFVIPPSVTQESNLPGERRQRKKAGKNKRPYHEIDSNGCVQLSRLTGEPIKLCHHCNISSRKAQLIMCDFCPLFFHADCLNPPLKYPPTTKWMCPVHPERMLLQNRDLFVSQRKAIADLFSEQVDPNFIITELLKKRQRSINLRPSTSKLLNDSSIELANAGSLPKRKSIVPLGIKKAYKTRRYIDECTASEADAELVLSCIPSFGREKLSEKQKRLSLLPDEEPKTPEEVDVPENYSCLLMPLEKDAPPIFVCEPISNIGTSPENDIVLQAEKCEAISPHHAVLYQDLSGSFELLNYSIHGMIVNGIEYGLEDPEVAVHKPDDPLTSDFTDRIHEMSKFGGWKITEDKKKVEWLKDKPIMSEDESDDESNAAKNASESEVANQSLAKLKKSPCPSPTPSVGSEKSKSKKRAKKSAKQSPEVARHKCGCSVPEPGWESPVQLSHGSVIQFGCNKYLFVSKDAYIEEPPEKEAKDQVKKEEVS